MGESVAPFALKASRSSCRGMGPPPALMAKRSPASALLPAAAAGAAGAAAAGVRSRRLVSDARSASSCSGVIPVDCCFRSMNAATASSLLVLIFA